MKDKLKQILQNALIQILGEIGEQEISFIDQPREDLTCEVIITIGITGNITGTMMLKSDQKSAASIARHMLKNIDHSPDDTVFTESQQEVIRELMNLISARALMILFEQNINCNLTPPTLITGKNIHPSMYNILYTVHAGVKGLFGEIYLFFGVKKLGIPGS
ncbi:MAG: chemotaxis protein CheX [Spirochaetales bacterium]|nr:chemotaxis protein CheX [Spirochaetales bacterium]